MSEWKDISTAPKDGSPVMLIGVGWECPSSASEHKRGQPDRTESARKRGPNGKRERKSLFSPFIDKGLRGGRVLCDYRNGSRLGLARETARLPGHHEGQLLWRGLAFFVSSFRGAGDRAGEFDNSIHRTS